MSTTLVAPGGAAQRATRKIGSIRRERRWALIGAYLALAVFVVFFLMPPFHMLVTSLKSSAEIADLQGSPWTLRIGTMNSDTAAPSGMSPPWMPSQNDQVANTWV